MADKKFSLNFWKEDDYFVGRLREVPGVFSQGTTLAELVENITDAYGLMVEENRASIPIAHYETMQVALPS